jgi:hypothetical protein
VEAIVLAVEAVVGETTIAAIHGNRANRAGSFSNAQGASDQAAKCLSAMNEGKPKGGVCQEADQHLQSAKKNTHGNRDKETRQSAGTNEDRTSLSKAAWTRWPNCANMLPHRRSYSTLVRRKLKLRRSQRPVAASASDS